MVYFILRSDEGQPSCVRPMTSGGTYLIMATQTVGALKHRLEFHHLRCYLDNRDFGERFRGKVPKSDCYHYRMYKAQSLMCRGTFDTLLSDESGSFDCIRIQFQREFNEIQRLLRPKRNFVEKSGKVKQSKTTAHSFYGKKRMNKNPDETRESSAKENRESSVKASSKYNLKMYSFCRCPHRLKGKSSKQQKAEFLRYTSDEFQKWISFGNQDNYENTLLKKLEELLLSEKKRMKNKIYYFWEKRRLFHV